MAEGDAAANAAAIATMGENLTILWLLFGAYLVFFMQVRPPATAYLYFVSRIFPSFLTTEIPRFFLDTTGRKARPRVRLCAGRYTGGKAEAWCLLIHADASLSHGGEPGATLYTRKRLSLPHTPFTPSFHTLTLVSHPRFTPLFLDAQAGFALLEAGSVRAKNTKNILLKNVLDACLGGAVQVDSIKPRVESAYTVSALETGIS